MIPAFLMASISHAVSSEAAKTIVLIHKLQKKNNDKIKEIVSIIVDLLVLSVKIYI